MNEFDIVDNSRSRGADQGAEPVSLALSTATRLARSWTGVEHSLSADHYDRQVEDQSLHVLIQNGFRRRADTFTTVGRFRELLTLYVPSQHGPVALTRRQFVRIIEGRLTDWSEVAGRFGPIHIYRLCPPDSLAKHYGDVLDRKLDLALAGIGTGLAQAVHMTGVPSYTALAAAAENDPGALLLGLREAPLKAVAPVEIDGSYLDILSSSSTDWPLSFDVNISVRCSAEAGHWLGLLFDTIEKRRATDLREMSPLTCAVGGATHPAADRTLGIAV